MHDSVKRAYAALPTRLYLIGTEGRVLDAAVKGSFEVQAAGVEIGNRQEV